MEIYYLTMSKEICQSIGAMNDENYLIAIKLLAAYHGVRAGVLVVPSSHPIV
jgi:hypothetical protein